MNNLVVASKVNGIVYSAKLMESDFVPFESRPNGFHSAIGSAPMKSNEAHGSKAIADAIAFAYRAPNGDITTDILIANGKDNRPVSAFVADIGVYFNDNLVAHANGITIYDGTAWFTRFGAPLGHNPLPQFCDWYFKDVDDIEIPDIHAQAHQQPKYPWTDSQAYVQGVGGEGVPYGVCIETHNVRRSQTDTRYLVGLHLSQAALVENARVSLGYRRQQFYSGEGGAVRPVHWHTIDPKARLNGSNEGLEVYTGKTGPNDGVQWTNGYHGALGRDVLPLQPQVMLGTDVASCWDDQHPYRWFRHILAWATTGSLADWWIARCGVEGILGSHIAQQGTQYAFSIPPRAYGYCSMILAAWLRAGCAGDPKCVEDTKAGLSCLFTKLESTKKSWPVGTTTLALESGYPNGPAGHYGYPGTCYLDGALSAGLAMIADLDAMFPGLAERAKTLYAWNLFQQDMFAGKWPHGIAAWPANVDPTTNTFGDPAELGSWDMPSALWDFGMRIRRAAPVNPAFPVDRLKILSDGWLVNNTMTAASYQNYRPNVALYLAGLLGWRTT